MKVFFETSSKIPVVSFALAFKCGATLDPPGKEGLSRTTARLFRRGTEGLGAEALEEAIDRLGSEFGADASPSTTSVHGEVISRNLSGFVDLLSRLVGAPSFAQEELGRLVREAQAELIEARDSDRGLASRAFRRTFFEGHPYARRVAGTLPSLASITLDDVREHYGRVYTRANAYLAISGDVTEKSAHEIAESIVSRLPEGAPVADPVADPEGKKGRHLVIVDKAERTQTQMVIGGLGSSARDPDHFAWIVGNTAFGGTFTSRLMQEVRAKRGWSYGASSRVGFDRHREAFTMWTAPSATDAAACLKLELELLAQLKTEGLKPEEVEFAKKYMIRSHAFEVDTAKKRVHMPLEEALYDLPEGYHSRYLQNIESVTPEQVNEALARRTPDEDLVVGVTLTNEATGAAIEEALPKRASTTVFPHDFE